MPYYYIIFLHTFGSRAHWQFNVDILYVVILLKYQIHNIFTYNIIDFENSLIGHIMIIFNIVRRGQTKDKIPAHTAAIVRPSQNSQDHSPDFGTDDGPRDRCNTFEPVLNILYMRKTQRNCARQNTCVVLLAISLAKRLTAKLNCWVG